MDERRSRPVPAPLRTMHLSLIAVWLGTALVSAIEHRGLSVQVLADAGIHDARWQTFLVWSGLLADLAVGLALWLLPCRKSYLAALLLMAAMTVLATVLQPTLWLHPLGPLLKNLPIAAMLLHLMSAPVTSKESA
ncbi:DoxX-like family protein [Delftia sp. DLF01]|uniref:DoxX-like family protein n=1 Tax=Delftia sp. DLF01 TaxID=2769279 RepID=UPI00177F04B8|nr:DoxX-like family protein [Delftia sp. DLF01]MBD9580604.1 DoxX-like family protein [Delftia sp. DLF01]